MNALDRGADASSALLTRLAERFDPAALSSAPARFDGAELPLVAPDSLDGFVEALRLAERDELRVVPVGLGSKLGWCAPPARADFLLSTRRFAGIVAHVPDDGTISVRAGTTLSELRAIARTGGHFLTPDVPRPDERTLGGVVAAGESGPDRLRFGPVRHHVLGAKVVLAGGKVSKSGGQLVKNVTGFDLQRLYCGSHGTLGVIVEVALRLFPEPEQELWFAADVEDRTALEHAQRALALPLRPVSLTLHARTDGGARRWSLGARLFGKRGTLDGERDAFLRAWPGARVLEDAAARAAAEELRDRAAGRAHAPSFHTTCLPSRVPQLLERAHARLGERWQGETWVQPGLAEIDFLPDEGSAPGNALAADLRRIAQAARGTLAWRNAPGAALAAFDPFGASAPGLDLMRAIRQQLDPRGVFATGRFHGGL